MEENLQKKDRDVCRVSALSKFAYQVAQGMNYLARQNLVHRDLSTRNILVFQPDLVSRVNSALTKIDQIQKVLFVTKISYPSILVI